MQISGIYTIRDTPQAHYWDIVFEWEDQISETLGIPLVPVGVKHDKIYRPNALKKILNRLNAFQWKDRCFNKPTHYYLAFHIGPPGVYSFFTRNNVIPVIIDFWRHEDLNRLQSVLRLSPAVFVTSMEVYNYLQSKNLKLKIQHISLSLPDKYYNVETGGRRDIDIIQIGRSNAYFNVYMDKFLNEFPSTHYVCAKKIGNELTIVSNKLGILGAFKKREEFVALLKRSKISLVSAPGLDEDRLRTGGFSPVTPRFMESAACGCNLLGIYPDNADFEYYGVSKVCESITGYDHFKPRAQEFIINPEVPDHTAFLQKHLTSIKATELLRKLNHHD